MDHEEYLSDASLIEDDGRIHQSFTNFVTSKSNLRIFPTKINVHKKR
jgi:hypothetical protein